MSIPFIASAFAINGSSLTIGNRASIPVFYDTRSSKAHGFTLIELMVAMGIFVLLTFMIVNVISFTTDLIKGSTARRDASGQARLVYNRIAQDWRQMVHRPDIEMDWANQSSNIEDPLARFWSRVSSPFPGSPNPREISLVAYRLAPHPETDGKLCLQRGTRGVSWNSPEFFGLKSQGDVVRLADLAAVDPAQYDVLGDGVIALAIGYQIRQDAKRVVLEDGTILISEGVAQPNETLTQLAGKITYLKPVLPPASGTAQLDVHSLAAIIITLVVVDSKTAALATREQIEQFASGFVVPGDDNLASQVWESKLSEEPTGFPPLHRSARVFQQAFKVPVLITK